MSSKEDVALEVVEQLLEHHEGLLFEDAGRGELSYCPECGADSTENKDPKRELVTHKPECAREKAQVLAEAFVRFVKATGELPHQDDLHRVSCTQVGEVGHRQCGWCDYHDRPRFICGCLGSRV